MFLRPHHLQQYDLFLESREVGFFRGLEHYAWGLIDVQFQTDSLDNFVLGVKSLKAVFPDGTLVDVPGNARLPSRQIDKDVFEAGRPLDVILGVRDLEERRPQVAGPGQENSHARYVPVDEEVYDIDAGQDPVAVERMEYDLHFFIGDEPTHGHAVLPLARLSLTGDAAKPIRFASGFSPPALAVSAAPVLHGAARSILERLATVLRDTSKYRGGDKAKELILYQALAGCLPVLKDMVSDGRIHPRRAYQEMARLAGTLYFRDVTNRSFDDIPAYDHQDPGPVFERLRDLIYELSEGIFEEPYRRIPMARSGDQFLAGLPGEVKKQGIKLYLEFLAEDSAPKARIIMMKAKTSGPARMETLQKFALPGIATEPQPGAPHELGPGQPGSYFRLKIEEGTEWATHVLPAGELAVLLVNAPPDLKLNLIVTLPAA